MLSILLVLNDPLVQAGNALSMPACCLARGRHQCFHRVPSLYPMYLVASLQIAPWKAKCIYICAVVDILPVFAMHRGSAYHGGRSQPGTRHDAPCPPVSALPSPELHLSSSTPDQG